MKSNKIAKLLGTVAVVASLAIPFGVLAAAPADFGLTEGDTIRASGDVDIFIVNEWGYKRLFVNPQIFNIYGHLGWDKVKTVTVAARDAFPTSGLFRNAESNDGKVYALEVVSDDVAVLHWVNVSGADAVAQDPAFFHKVFNINNAEQALYGVGAPYTSLSQIPGYSVAGNGGLNGGAGSLDDATFISSLNNEEVGEGDSNVKVLGLDLDADNGSDLRFLSVKLVLENMDGASSEDLDDYADSVSVWLGSKKLADVDVDEFNENDGVWSKSISLSNDAIVRMDASGKLYVAVSAVDNIDSSDLATNDWVVQVDSLRYVDAEGAITTDTSTGDIGVDRGFSFKSYADAANLSLSLEEASDNPEDGTYEVDNENGADGLLLLSGTLKAEGGDIEVKEVNVDVVGSVAIDSIAEQFILEIDGNEVQTLDASDCAAGVCEFDDVDTMIAEDEEVDVRVLVDVNGTDEYGNGESLAASLDSSDIVAEDQNGDDMTNLDGAVSGGEMQFANEGVDVDLVDVSATKETEPTPDLGTFTIKFKVTAYGSDVTVTGAAFNLASASAVADSLTVPGDDFDINEGESKTFTLVVIGSGMDDFAKLTLTGVNTDLGAFVVGDEFETDPLFLSAN